MKKIIIFSLLALGIASCSPAYYPQKINAPLLREEGESKISAAGNINSINIQAATALTENFAIAGSFNGFFVRPGDVSIGGSSSEEGGSTGFQVDVMPGFYVPFGDIGVIELYGGLGTGLTNSDEVTGLLHRLIFQPSVGIAGEHFEFAFSTRFTHVLIPSTSFNDPTESTFSNTFLEPGLIFRLGSDKVKFTGQIGFSLPITNILEDENFVEWNPLIINLGVQFTFFKDWKKNNPPPLR